MIHKVIIKQWVMSYFRFLSVTGEGRAMHHYGAQGSIRKRGSAQRVQGCWCMGLP
jgi:hypothetical protein